jgi:putative FmdB family regulatory protein
MPTYDYVCGACGHRLEHFQSMTSRRLRKCPDCGERKLERLVGSGAGLIFKGSGFYETDYKQSSSKPSPEPAAEKKSDAKEPGAAKPTKSDAKESGSATGPRSGSKGSKPKDDA